MLAEYQMQVQYILVSRNYGVLCNFASLETKRKIETRSKKNNRLNNFEKCFRFLKDIHTKNIIRVIVDYAADTISAQLLTTLKRCLLSR